MVLHSAPSETFSPSGVHLARGIGNHEYRQGSTATTYEVSFSTVTDGTCRSVPLNYDCRAPRARYGSAHPIPTLLQCLWIPSLTLYLLPSPLQWRWDFLLSLLLPCVVELSVQTGWTQDGLFISAVLPASQRRLRRRLGAPGGTGRAAASGDVPADRRTRLTHGDSLL